VKLVAEKFNNYENWGIKINKYNTWRTKIAFKPFINKQYAIND